MYHITITELNFNERIKKMQLLVNIWSPRNLSLKGKICIIKTLILPHVQFLFSMIYVPNYVLKQIDEMLFKFLWSNKPPKIKRDTIIARIENGGLGMTDVYAVHDTAKSAWVQRFFCKNDNNAKWKILFKLMINVECLNKNIDPKEFILGKSDFHQQVGKSWFNITNTNANNITDVLNQYIFFNRYIRIGSYITPESLGNNLLNMNTKILNIINEDGNFLSLNNLNVRLNSNLSILQYNSLISSIPKAWKDILRKRAQEIDIEQEDMGWEPNVTINGINKGIAKIKSKDLYHLLISRVCKMPTSIDTWINIYPFLEQQDWDLVFKLPYKIVTEPYLQSFQYKILNRILNTREKLFQWKMSENSNCLSLLRIY